MDFEVEITDLRDSAKAARDAAAEVGKVKPGDAILAAVPALPGSRSADRMDEVANRWVGSITAWAKQAKSYARTLDDNADQYAGDDAAARDAFWVRPPTKGFRR